MHFFLIFYLKQTPAAVNRVKELLNGKPDVVSYFFSGIFVKNHEKIEVNCEKKKEMKIVSIPL